MDGSGGRDGTQADSAAASASAVRARRFSMSELVDQVGVPAATIRYYLAEGLLPPPVKVAANRFLYDERHVEVVRLVRLLRERRGLSLESIRSLLPTLFPDLTGSTEHGAFRQEMWQELLLAHPRGDIRESTRARILEAGLAAFARHGYAEVSIDDLCRAVGIAKGSFYRYFDSKEELFFAAAAEAARRSVATLVESAAGGGPLLERIADAVLPWLCIVLDLAALASQRRPGHARGLRSYLVEIHEAIAPELPGLSSDELAEIVEVGVARAVRRVTSESNALGSADQLPPVSAGGGTRS